MSALPWVLLGVALLVVLYFGLRMMKPDAGGAGFGRKLANAMADEPDEPADETG